MEVCEYVADIETMDTQSMQLSISVPAMLDQVILKDSRVLDNMLNGEGQVTQEDFCSKVQSRIAPHMRKIVTD